MALSKTSSLLESSDSLLLMVSGICLVIDGGWLDLACTYIVVLFGFA